MIELRHVTKRFGGVTALDDIGFTVASGRLTGFVGSNGAGKTTAMRVLMGVLQADEGQVLQDGHQLDAQTRRQFGYMPEERGLYPKMKVAEQLVYLAKLHGFSATSARKHADDLLERLGLGVRAGDPVDALSLGNQQRAQVAAALIHRPNVLVLDEPFSGLDPMAVDAVAEVLIEQAQAGATVLFSSHQLDLVERLCDDLIIIANGKVRAAGERGALGMEHGSPRFELAAVDTKWLQEIPEIQILSSAGDVTVFTADEAAAQRVLRAALDRGNVRKFGQVVPSLAEIFREVIVDEVSAT